MKFLWIKALCTLGSTSPECIDYIVTIHLGISCTVFVLIGTVFVLYCFVMCGCVYVWVL